MHAFICKIGEFLRKNAKKIIIFGGIIVLCLFIGFMFGRSTGENVSSDRESVNSIRNELDQAEGAKQDIADTAGDITSTSTDIAETVGNLAESIDNVTDTSKQFDSILGECQNIIEQIRNQPAGE